MNATATLLCRLCAVAATALAMAGAQVRAQSEGIYTIRFDRPQQVIRGIGVEIQSDSIGSGNAGMPDEVSAVPHDLTPAERVRFSTEMLHGFRYVRLAMGLYLRGTDADQKHIVERYRGQMDELRAMQDVAGIDGFDVEYWSPAPYWKQGKSYYGGTIAAHDSAFLNGFSDALIDDLRYLQSHGLRVAMWGLQNEPGVGHPRLAGAKLNDDAMQSYATCYYTPEDYAAALKVAVPKVRALLPKVQIQAPSWDGPAGEFAVAIRRDPELLKEIDAWTWHQIGHDSNDQIDKREMYLRDAGEKPVYSNEFEYQPWDKPGFNSYFMNTGQSLMNWMVFENSPTWFWLHALKPVTNMEAGTYALGFWRPYGELKQNLRPALEAGHWEFNPQNWNAVAGFVRYLSWDSTRLQVDEDEVRRDQRILVWCAKDERVGIALSNRGAAPFTFHLHGLRGLKLEGHRYMIAAVDQRLKQKQGSEDVAITVQPQSFEFWMAVGR
jgi:O-glycosyl hydrolase/ribosomal protein L36